MVTCDYDTDYDTRDDSQGRQGLPKIPPWPKGEQEEQLKPAAGCKSGVNLPGSATRRISKRLRVLISRSERRKPLSPFPQTYTVDVQGVGRVTKKRRKKDASQRM